MYEITEEVQEVIDKHIGMLTEEAGKTDITVILNENYKEALDLANNRLGMLREEQQELQNTRRELLEAKKIIKAFRRMAKAINKTVDY